MEERLLAPSFPGFLEPRSPPRAWECVPGLFAGDSPAGLGLKQAALPLPSEQGSPPPGRKTIIKIYLKKPPSLLLLTLAVRYRASTKCCIQKFCLPGLSPAYRTPLNLVGLFSHVFLMRKYVRDYWHHRFLPSGGFRS